MEGKFLIMQQFPYIAEIFVIGGIASAAVIAADLRSCRQPMRIMNSVWILTGLWASFLGLLAYYAFGRVRKCTLDEKAEHAGSKMEQMRSGAGMKGMEMDEMKPEDAKKMSGMNMPGMDMPKMNMSEMPAKGMKSEKAAGMRGMQMQGMDMDMPGMQMVDMAMPARPQWQSVVLSTLHCGAGCTLADLVGEWFFYLVPVAIGGSLIAGSWIIDYLLALLFGIGFQYAAIRGMEPATPRGEIVRRAAKADVLSLTAWQIGMYGWMAIVIFVLNNGVTLPRTTFQFWFMMQIAMACGFLVALPVNVLLIRAGIKKGM